MKKKSSVRQTSNYYFSAISLRNLSVCAIFTPFPGDIIHFFYFEKGNEDINYDVESSTNYLAETSMIPH